MFGRAVGILALVGAPWAALADNLHLERVSAAAAGAAGATLRVEFDVLVTGVRQPFAWAAFASPTGALAGARALGEHTAPRPTADGRMRVSADVALPADLSGGSYYVVVELDPRGAVAETNPLDDVLATDARSRVSANRADVRLGAPRLLTPRAQVGDVVTVEVEVVNQGLVRADVELVAVLDRDGSISPTDAELTRVSVSLDAGRAQTLRLSGPAPGALRAGDHYVGVIADPAGLVGELTESNNLVIAATRLSVFEPRLALETASIPAGTVFQRYFARLAASGGDGHYRFAISRGRIPSGLALDAVRGEISGAPLTSGTHELSIEVRSDGRVDEKTFSFEVSESGLELAVVTPELPAGTLGLPYEAALEAAGGEPPYRWTVLSGSLPNGLDLGTDGRIRGVPGDEGSFSLVVEVRDALGGTLRVSYDLVVGPANVVIMTLEPPAIPLGEPASIQLEAKGGQAPYEWIARSTPPPGLSLSEDGVLSGVPAKVGRFAMRVEVLDARERRRSDTALVFVEVEDHGEFEVVIPTIPALALRQPLDVTLTIEGGRPPFVWRVDPRDELPSGFKLEPAPLGEGSARLSGASVRAIDRAFLLEVTDRSGRVRSAIVELHVDAVTSGAGSGGCASTGAPGLASLLLVCAALLLRRRSL